MDKFSLALSPAAQRDLDRLEERVVQTVNGHLHVLRENPFPKGKLIKKIKGKGSEF